MSLLTQTPIQPDRAQQKAKRLLNTPAQIFSNLKLQWEQTISAIWDDPNPQTVLAVIGASAGELFKLSAQLGAFLESLEAGSTAAGIAKVKAFTVNPDGTVTVTVQPE